MMCEYKSHGLRPKTASFKSINSSVKTSTEESQTTNQKMKLLICSLLALAVLGAAQSPEDAPSAEYLPPVAEVKSVADDATPVAEDGYRYKTVRRLRYRHRRDVSQEYLPPVVDAATEPSQEYLPPVAETKVADDGYRYKTVRRLRYRARHRRDVSAVDAQTPSNEYLPPVEVELAPELKTIVGDDGYQYQTVRRLKYRRRHRREADAAAAAGAEEETAGPAAEYLPPVMEEAAAVKSADQGTELAKDGYRYKTVRRLKYRYRH